MTLSKAMKSGLWREKLSKLAFPLWLLCVLIFSFQLFDNSPFVRSVHIAEVPVLIFLGVFALFHFGRKLYGKGSFSPCEMFLACLLCLPLISAVSAWLSFEQPVWMGFLADRRWFRAIAGLFVFQLLISQRIRWKLLHRTFLILAFGSLLVYLSMWMFLDPNSLAGGFFFVEVPSKGMRLRIVPVFVIWGAIYFVLGWIRSSITKPRFATAMISVFMVGYVVFIYKSRATILVLAAVLFLLVMTKTEKGQRVRVFIILCLLTAVVAGGMWAVRPEKVKRQLSGFTAIASSLYRGTGEMDASLANRLSQGTVAWWSISRSVRSLLFGNGRLSRRWGGEPKEDFGHFYPVDIGWLGIIFLYGFLGLVLVNVPFLMAWKFSREKQCENDDIFLESLQWWLVYLFFRSILNAVVVANPSLVIVPLFLIYWRCQLGAQGDKL